PGPAMAGSWAFGPQYANMLLVAGWFGECDPEREILVGATAACHDELVDGVRPEHRRGGTPGIGGDGEDKRGGAWRARKDIQVTRVDAPVGAVGGAVKMVRHRSIPPRDW